jgi:hypothetical protein
MQNINVNHYKSYYLWFEVFHPLHEEVINAEFDEINPKADLTANFDYEIVSGDLRHIYIDIGLRYLPVAAILTRSCFEFRFNGKWDKLMVPEFFNAIIPLAIEKCIKGFEEQCIQHNLQAPKEVIINEQITSSITESLIKLYSNYRKYDDVANLYLITKRGLRITTGKKTLRIFKITFAVIDALLYYNDVFDRRNNREMFTEIMPEVVYFSLKLKCLELVNHEIELSIKETVFFLLCLDFSMQILLGDLEETLMKALAKQGMSETVRELYIKNGAEFIDDYNKLLKKCDVSIKNLENRTDWNNLIR